MSELKTKLNVLGFAPGTCHASTGLHNGYMSTLRSTGSDSAENDSLRVRVNERALCGGLARINVCVTAKEDTFLTSLSCLFLQGILAGRDFSRDGSLYLWLCRQTWNGEGRWERIPLSALDFYPKSTHQSTDSLHLVSTGSWTTANLYPTVLISDEGRGSVWVFQFEPVGGWHIELGYQSADSSLFVSCECVSDRYLQSGVRLGPGQALESEYVTFGRVDGGFNAALAALTCARREFLGARERFPVVYNDYMNCLWGNPSAQALLPLIDRAAQAGAEVFCVDAGWFTPAGMGWSQSLGDWEPSPDRFGPAGFAGIVDYIRGKGMRAGCWLELECVSADAEIFGMPDDWFLCKYGKRIGGGVRHFFNFTNPEVCAYLARKVRHLYALGIRYIKNDYNDCMGSGVDLGDGSGPGWGVNRALRAFYAFADALKAEFPDLLIENCASGAMRSDYAALAHFDLQSVTDQEDYVRCHAVTAGTLVNLLPEHMGVWACPIPLEFADMERPEVLQTPAYRARMQSGEQTAFSLINGMLGNLYLSGRIDAADAFNFGLIREGVAYYKGIQHLIFRGIPGFLTALPALDGDNCFSAVLYVHPEKSLLFVFRLGEEERFEADLNAHGRFDAVRVGFGGFGGKRAALRDGRLTVVLPQKNSAIVLELTERKGGAQ